MALAACEGELLMPPVPVAVDMPRPVGIEIACADVDAGTADAPASPLDEVRIPAAHAAEPLRIAVGRGAAQLGADAVLAAGTNDGGAAGRIASSVDDRDAVELVLIGRTDFALTTVPLSARDRAAGLQDTLLALELFALVVAESSPLHDLRADQVRRLLTGELADGRELGLPMGALRLCVPADRALRERAARALIPGDAFTAAATPVDGDRGAFDLLLREPGTVALVHVASLPRAQGLRTLAIDGARPSVDAFVRGAYRAATPLLLVTAGSPQGAARELAAASAAGTLPLAADWLVAPRD